MSEAVRRLSESVVSGSLRSSQIYETKPVGPTGNNPFLNAVIEFQTDWTADDLFRFMQTVESDLGRRPPRSGPRTIDLDMLFYDDLVQRTDFLKIPHPRLHERDFVLRPLADLDPELVHPILNRSIRDLLDDIVGESCIIGVFAPEIPGPDEQ
ncbi:MAG: 2-amino-4-hydroxy-6-hydroxymethyldihydropteridine diphosphokinase [candidate division Zixibacteria bacterium]|nr:2-amino-4-hydroxy-6-hydroxymethyldihydropteridine diphosphokinase [candidate division Zixibacteria bacterium]